MDIAPLQLQIIGMTASTAMPLIIAIIILNSEERTRVIKLFLCMLGAVFFWALFGLLFYLLDKESLILLSRGLSASFITAISTTYIFFAVAFYKGIQNDTKKYHRTAEYAFLSFALLIVIGIAADLLGFSKYIVAGVETDAVYRHQIIPGSFAWALILHFVGGTLIGSLFIFSARKGASDKERAQIKWIIVTLIVSFLVGATRFATWYDFPISPSIATLASVIFTLGLLHALNKHKLFNSRVLSTQFVVVMMLLILFYRLFLAPDTLDTVILDNVVLFISLFLGLYLMRNVTINTLQREKLRVQAEKLSVLNSELEQEVRNRTREVYDEKDRLNSIVDNLVSGFIEYTHSYEILRINKSAETMLGITRQDVLNRTWGDSLGKDAVSIIYSLFDIDKNYHTDPAQVPITTINKREVTIHHPETRHLLVIAAPTQKDASADQTFMLLIQDITEIRELELLKNDFITIAAHQLRTPLTQMRYALEITTKEDQSLSEESRAMIIQTQASTQKMLTIVNQLLQVSEIELKNMTYDLTKSNIEDVLTEVIDEVREGAREQNNQIEYVREELPNVKFDQQKMKLVLTNVLTNAIMYSRADGVIEVTTHVNDTMLTISIADHGIGINQEEVENIFKKFYRSEAAIKTATDNSGLGLFISRKIVEGHGGKLTIDSKKDVGTIISISLPR